jgi:hypothetical protein
MYPWLKRCFTTYTTLSIVLLLIIVHLLYVALIAIPAGEEFALGDNFFLNLTGLFIPALFFNTAYTFGIAPILTIAICIFFDQLCKKYDLGFKTRFIYAFIILFILTTFIDIVLWGEPVSINLFLYSISLIDDFSEIHIWDGLINVSI